MGVIPTTYIRWDDPPSRYPVIPHVRIRVNEPPNISCLKVFRVSLHTDPHQVFGGFWMSTVGLLDDQVYTLDIQTPAEKVLEPQKYT